jgi:hypothetical protein
MDNTKPLTARCEHCSSEHPPFITKIHEGLAKAIEAYKRDNSPPSFCAQCHPHITQLGETIKDMTTSIQRRKEKTKDMTASIQRRKEKRTEDMLAIARMENMLEDEGAAFENEVENRRDLGVALYFMMAILVREKLSVDEKVRGWSGL